jgi:hypothetical protein
MPWKRIQFRGMDCLVFEGRPEGEKVKYPRKDYFYYAMRHGESDWVCPISIEKFVFVNYWGVIGTPKPLSFSNGYLKLTRREAERFAERG